MVNLTGLFVAGLATQAVATFGYSMTQTLMNFLMSNSSQIEPLDNFIQNGEKVFMGDLALMAPAYAIFLFVKKDINNVLAKAKAIHQIIVDR